MNKLLLLIMVAVMVTGCAPTRKDFYATGGSRADGSIDMAYDFIAGEDIVVDPLQAQSIAGSKCTVWGYERAEAFGGKSENCLTRSGSGECEVGQVIVKYQCIGNITPSSPQPVSYQQPMPYQPSAPTAMLTPAQHKELRLKALLDQNLPYGEYQEKYQAIMAE